MLRKTGSFLLGVARIISLISGKYLVVFGPRFRLVVVSDTCTFDTTISPHFDVIFFTSFSREAFSREVKLRVNMENPI